MSRSLLAGAAVLAALLCSVDHANAATIADSLVQATTNGLWSTHGSTDYVISSGASGTTIYYTSGTSQPAGEVGEISSNFSFDGDFVLSVRQVIAGLPISQGSFYENGGPYVGQQNGAAFVGPWNTSNGPVTNGSVFENSVYIGGPVHPLSSEDNTIKIERVGNTILESIAPVGSNTFAPLYSASGQIFSGPTFVTLDYFVQGTTPAPSGTITYSNFSVSYGGAGVPEPVTWAMFLVGFGALGLMARASRRTVAAITP